jgi:hypothetical protein
MYHIHISSMFLCLSIHLDGKVLKASLRRILFRIGGYCCVCNTTRVVARYGGGFSLVLGTREEETPGYIYCSPCEVSKEFNLGSCAPLGPWLYFQFSIPVRASPKNASIWLSCRIPRRLSRHRAGLYFSLFQTKFKVNLVLIYASRALPPKIIKIGRNKSFSVCLKTLPL